VSFIAETVDQSSAMLITVQERFLVRHERVLAAAWVVELVLWVVMQDQQPQPGSFRSGRESQHRHVCIGVGTSDKWAAADPAPDAYRFSGPSSKHSTFDSYNRSVPSSSIRKSSPSSRRDTNSDSAEDGRCGPRKPLGK
jgi:hypothetical protein